jgi:Undecaprenyl-phosphate glucose phosphotransferase
VSTGQILFGENNTEISRIFNFGHYNRTLMAAAQMAGDGLILTLASYLSYRLVLYPYHQFEYLEYFPYFLLTIGTTILMILSFALSGVYDVLDGRDSVVTLGFTVKCLVTALLLLTACLFILKISDNVSRLWLGTWSLASAVALSGFRLFMALAARRLRESGRLTRNIAVVGASEIGHQLALKFTQDCPGSRLVGLFDERRSRFVQGSGGTTVYQLSVLYELLCKGHVDEIVIAIPSHASIRIVELSRRFHPFAVSLRVLAPEGYENFRVLDSRRYDDIGTFRVMGKPLDDVAVLVKRIEDVVIASACLLLTFPLLLVIALSIKLHSRGPVLFKQKRLGAHNLPFGLLKFRTMFVEQTDPLGQQLTRAGDPRITRVGRFLRMTSMDELPQLINVLRGEMSLVGPRPHALAANAAGVAYARAISDYPIRHRVKPGITGWAQVNGWRGETTTIEQIRKRVEHDLYYVENWSLTFDLLILGRTVFAVLSRANAI